ncbi:PE-PGRS family protein [Streptomyces sp. NBC_01235]|uniref:PE-PGRS family protein n=1 Tax=Streptomyces sp. NBC_01235 TaxID=2903788 RepID=UPI002E12644A|nr:PE-PGRS family protein [Streptomyces sp. NBC_01235]
MTLEELKALLRRAGLEIAEPWWAAGPLPLREAWRRIASGETAPTVTVRGDRAAEVNVQWYRIAVETGLFDADGTFLIVMEGPGQRTWARVRLAPGWDFAGVLGELPDGRPKFVAMAVDGDTVLGVTGTAEEVRITVVDRIAERLDSEARAAVQETPSERAQAWESLFEEASASLCRHWANGLSGNPAAPEDVRVALLDATRYPLYRAESAAVVEAAMARTDWGTRETLAEYQPNLTPEQRSRMILSEEEPGRRAGLVWIASRRGVELPAVTCERLAADPSALVRAEVAGLLCLPVPVLTALATDSHASVRAAACGPAWPHLDDRAREGLLADPDGSVRTAALLRRHEDHPMPWSVFEALGLPARAVECCRLEPEVAERLAREDAPGRRRSLARNPHLDTGLVLRLADDPDDDVRFQASVHPGLTEEERARVDFPIDQGLMRNDLAWVVALHDVPDAMRRLAASAHPAIRRSVARARRLPPDVVERLAKDEDRVVHLFLTESCDDAPSQTLLSVWRWWTGSLSHPDRPHGHPNFPRTGLLRYADDPSPRMRRLALDDPDATAELVERACRDSGEEVRARAAGDPRLSAVSAVRLLSDPDSTVRHSAVRHPGLPARVLVGLLRDTETAEQAARHPGLPLPVIRRMLHEIRERGVA